MTMAYGTPIKDAVVRDPDPKKLYRVEAVSYAAIQPYADQVSGDGEWYTTDPALEVFDFDIIRETPCGATVSYSHGSTKWVDLQPGKQWASRTVEEALRQFEARRKSQIWILKKQLSRAERELALALDFVSGRPHMRLVSNGDT